MEDESFFAKKPFRFSKLLIINLSPNFSFSTWSAFPMPSIKPNFKEEDPDQNSPVKVLFFSVSISFEPLLSSTTFIKSEWSSNCIFFSL